MKRFFFSLERVLNLRRSQLEAAEARLHQTVFHKTLARRNAESIQKAFNDFSEKTARLPVATGAELRAAENYLNRLENSRLAEMKAEAEWEQQRLQHLKEVIEARRKVKLLETLRVKRLTAHTISAEREQDVEASEVYLAKWVRERRSWSAFPP